MPIKWIRLVFLVFCLVLAGCEKNQPSAVPAGSAEASAPRPKFELVAYGSFGHQCKIQLMLINKMPVRIDAIAIGVTGKLDYARKTGYWRADYVPANGNSDFFYESFFADCYNQCKIEVQEVEFCKIDGRLYSNCLDHLAVRSNDSRCSIEKAKK